MYWPPTSGPRVKSPPDVGSRPADAWCGRPIRHQRQAELSRPAVTDMFFNAALLDWSTASQKWQQIADQLNQGSHVRIAGRDTDLSFSVAGRRWVVLDGKLNLPDGEIFTAPVNRTLQGHITFELPGVLSDRLMHNIRLAWDKGELVEASATTNASYLHQILATDAGARRVDEFGNGTKHIASVVDIADNQCARRPKSCIRSAQML
ncbi:MAG: aminopeptidase [Caldilineaceae bacterium]